MSTADLHDRLCRIELTVIFADVLILIFYKFSVQTDNDSWRQYQFCSQNFMVIPLWPLSLLIAGNGCYKVISTMLFPKINESCHVYNDTPVFPKQFGTLKSFPPDQAFYHLFSYIHQTCWGQAFQIIIQDICMRHFHQPSIAG